MPTTGQQRRDGLPVEGPGQFGGGHEPGSTHGLGPAMGTQGRVKVVE